MNALTNINRSYRKACLGLYLFLITHSALAQRALSIEPAGVDLEENDPVAFGFTVLAYVVNFVVIVLGVLFLVLWIKDLIKNFAEAREDGKWGKVGTTAVGGLVVLLILAWIATFTLSLIE